MNYFNLADKHIFSQAAGKAYVAGSPAVKWHNDTRNKLEYLIKLLEKALNITLIANYREYAHKRGGQGKPLLLKDYVIRGFVPSSINVGKSIFIKLEFRGMKTTNPIFVCEIDINASDPGNIYHNDRPKLRKDTYWGVPLDENFPSDWDSLLELLLPIVKKNITYLQAFLKNKAIVSSPKVNENVTQYKMSANTTSNFPLNQILFGPPGTGKTYHTINMAIAIIENKELEDINKEDRVVLKKRYEEYVEKGQIVFTTFHQSMSYEDFIEGIKPQEPEPEKEGQPVNYKVDPGVFKKLCDAALTPNQQDFNTAYEQLTKELIDIDKLPLKTPSGKEFSISLNTKGNLTLYTGTKQESNGTLTKENIQKEINGEDKFIGWQGYFKGVIDYLESEYNYSSVAKGNNQNYVIIIDEINRGNVSQIFGELITLIESDKRLGRGEELKVVLPYSKKEFAVPSNVFLIGTMNTADRSVEALDTALRRRFSFVEMMPKSELLAPNYMFWRLLWDYSHVKWNDSEYQNKEKNLLEFLGASDDILNNKSDKWDIMEKEGMDINQKEHFSETEFTGYNLKTILETINSRIEVLLGRDNLIGHSYFMKVNSEKSLKETIIKNIIPLLQEYFFGDYGKIGLVLGEGFVRIKRDEYQKKVSFAKFSYDDRDSLQKLVYELIPAQEVNIQEAIQKLLSNEESE